MNKPETVPTNTPEDSASALGLGDAETHEWQFQLALLERLRHIGHSESLNHAQVRNAPAYPEAESPPS